MPTAMPNQPVKTTTDERPVGAASTPSEPLVDLQEVTENAPAVPVSAPASDSAEEQARREQLAAAATVAATQDLAAVRSQLARHPSEPPIGAAVQPVTAAPVSVEAVPVPAPPVPTSEAVAAASVQAPPAPIQPVGVDQSTTPTGTPDERDAVADAEMVKRGMTRETATLDQMIDLVRQSIYPNRRVETVTDQPTGKPATDDGEPQPDATAGPLESSASLIEAGIAEHQPDADQPVAPTKVVEQPVESSHARVDASSPTAPAEAAS